MNAQFVIAVVELVLKYGPTIALKIIEGLPDKDPTPEQIRALLVDEDVRKYFDGPD